MNLLGATVKPDTWKKGTYGHLVKGNSFKDESFPGCAYYLESGLYTDQHYAVNIHITGRKSVQVDYDEWRTRVRIEFVGDGEPSKFVSGYIYTIRLPLITEVE